MRQFLNTLVGKATKSAERRPSARRTNRTFLNIEALEERELLSTTAGSFVGAAKTGISPYPRVPMTQDQVIIYVEELPTAKSSTPANANAADLLVFFDHIPSHPLYQGVNTVPVNTFGNPVTNTTPVNTFGNPVTNTTPVNTFGQPVTNTTPVNTFGQPVTNTTPVNTFGQPVTNTTPVNTFGQTVGNTTPVNTSGNPVTTTTAVNTLGQPVTNTTPVNTFGTPVYTNSVVDSFGTHITQSVVQVSQPVAPPLPPGVVYPAYLHVNNVMDAAGLSSLLQAAFSSLFEDGPGSGTPYGALAGGGGFVPGPGSNTPYGALAGPGSGTPYGALTSGQAGQIYIGAVTASFNTDAFNQDVQSWVKIGAAAGATIGAIAGAEGGPVGAAVGGGVGGIAGGAIGLVIGTIEGIWDGLFHH